MMISGSFFAIMWSSRCQVIRGSPVLKRLMGPFFSTFELNKRSTEKHAMPTFQTKD